MLPKKLHSKRYLTDIFTSLFKMRFFDPNSGSLEMQIKMTLGGQVSLREGAVGKKLFLSGKRSSGIKAKPLQWEVFNEKGDFIGMVGKGWEESVVQDGVDRWAALDIHGQEYLFLEPLLEKQEGLGKRRIFPWEEFVLKKTNGKILARISLREMFWVRKVQFEFLEGSESDHGLCLFLFSTFSLFALDVIW